MNQAQLSQLFKRFDTTTVLVIGDVMIDSYLWGKVDRISPEAPVPVVRVTEKENRLGGAANVVLNLAALGSKPIICSVIGDDTQGKLLAELFEKDGLTSAGLVASTHRPTTVKTRVICRPQHIVRVDEESLKPLNNAEESALLHRIAELIEAHKPAVIVFEDYNKGVLTERVITQVIDWAKEKSIPTAVDPKKDHFFDYRGVSLFKPNLKELSEGLKLDINRNNMEEVESAAAELQTRIGNQISLITLSEAGVLIKTAETSTHIPAFVRNIADVSGAGDTVISVAALCLAHGVEPKLLAALSNLAGGLVCEKVGVVPVDKKLLETEAIKHLAQP